MYQKANKYFVLVHNVQSKEHKLSQDFKELRHTVSIVNVTSIMLCKYLHAVVESTNSVVRIVQF